MLHTALSNDVIDLFLKKHGYGDCVQSTIPRDASKRQYMRLEGAKRLLMISPESEKPAQFMAVGDLLNRAGLSTPKFFETQPEYDLYLLEDFGEYTYRKALSASEDEAALYTLAVSTLTHIAETITTKPDFLKTYDHTTALTEAMLFTTWFGDGFSESAQTDFRGIFEGILQPFQMPMTIMLRDYHMDNLFYLKDRVGVKQCGLIDFQDAMWGPVGYDLISLTHDVRRDMDEPLREILRAQYLSLFDKDMHGHLDHTFDVLNLARHFRIFGVFSRLAKRDGKPHYLDHFPRMISHVRHLFKQNSYFRELASWCDAHRIILA